MRNAALILIILILTGCQPFRLMLESCPPSSEPGPCSVGAQIVSFSETPSGISINGRVVDPKNRKPLQGVLVRVVFRAKDEDNYMLTGRKGRFALDNLSTGQALIFSAEGYRDLRWGVGIMMMSLEKE